MVQFKTTTGIIIEQAQTQLPASNKGRPSRRVLKICECGKKYFGRHKHCTTCRMGDEDTEDIPFKRLVEL